MRHPPCSPTSSFRSPTGERAGNHTRGGRQSFQCSSQGCCYGFVCVCGFFFHKGHGLGHQGSVGTDFACLWQRGRSRAAVSQRHLVGPRPPPRTAGTEGPGQPLREPGSPWGTRPGAVAEGQGPGQPRRDPARAPHGSRGEAFGRGHGALALGKSSEGLDALWKHSLLPSCKPFWSLSQGF